MRDPNLRRSEKICASGAIFLGVGKSRERSIEVSQSGGEMSVVRLLGFTTLYCGCVIGRYREVATSRELGYVEEKGQACPHHGHRRNHTVLTSTVVSKALAPSSRAL
jgi:hypothetical protein